MNEYLGIYILTSHLLSSLLIGWVAKKYFDRNFLIWFAIAFLVPVVSGIALLILGYEGIYCPHCGKKVRKNSENCKHCGFHLKKFFEDEIERRKIERELSKKWKR